MKRLLLFALVMLLVSLGCDLFDGVDVDITVEDNTCPEGQELMWNNIEEEQVSLPQCRPIGIND